MTLKSEDVDLENTTISVWRALTKSGGRLLLDEPKTKKSRGTIRLTEAAARMLREQPLILCCRLGRRVAPALTSMA